MKNLLIDDNRKAIFYYIGAIMEISIKQKSVTCIRSIWFVAMVLLAAGQGVYADQQHPKDANSRSEGKSGSSASDSNDPNELWWRRWDAAVKNPSDPHELLEVKCRAVITVLQDKELEQKLKEKIIDKIMSPVFDFPLMGKLALGREHWPKLTEQQRDKFTRLFVERLKNTYLEKITLYKDEKVLFEPAVQKKNAVHIPMVLMSDGKGTAILYKLHKAGERWKIYDVEIQGVSILLTYRSQFDDILRRGSVEDLLIQLEKPPTQ